MPDLKSIATSRPAPASHPEPLKAPPVKGFIETSFLDWKGKISAVLFLPGCNFRCPFCHNFNLVTDPDSYVTFELEDVIARLRPFLGWIDGVVVSGGEPTLHPGLEVLLATLKQEGFAVKLDTNGSRPKVVKRLVESGLVDMVAMDLKAPLDEASYRRVTGCGVDVEAVRESLTFVKNCGVDHQFRSTIWPAWHGKKELAAMARDVSGAAEWTLQIMNPDKAWNPGPLGKGGPYEQEEIDALQAGLADPVCLRG